MKDFAILGLSEQLRAIVAEQGIVEPTPIQISTIPPALEGRDIIGQAQTGTGKTLAFLLPLLQKIQVSNNKIQALILSPTRELAIQITEEANKIVRKMNDIHVVAVYGGQDVVQQIHKLNGNIHIVIATPGRLLDHIRRGTIDISQINMLVLDEADQMLHMGFLQEVLAIIEQTPTTRQTLMYSATLPVELKSVATLHMKDPYDIRVKREKWTIADIDQYVVETTDRAKQETLRNVLDEQQPFLAIIFCRTKRRVNRLHEALHGFRYLCDVLHGDLSQTKREEVMIRFRKAEIQYLIATDVAARGLDVEGVTHVINYDIPHDIESYIHRIGRTGRAGEKGVAITLVAQKDKIHLAHIENELKVSIEKVKTKHKRN
ncbi:DEAD/DEAH box helicase [Alkalihalobacterium bogoriense]|uniref:DEAD/DEAH box helicase n=1 Tax=Alkalihalobacterium bogoriense TaxID=246272 RepID=UPI00068431A2|nr:DEAD/DEAH box helicase [Alkalihalobacterium bogoriense]